MLRLITEMCSYDTSTCLSFDHVAAECNLKFCIMVNCFVGNVLAILGYGSYTLYQLVFDILQIMPK